MNKKLLILATIFLSFFAATTLARKAFAQYSCGTTGSGPCSFVDTCNISKTKTCSTTCGSCSPPSPPGSDCSHKADNANEWCTYEDPAPPHDCLAWSCEWTRTWECDELVRYGNCSPLGTSECRCETGGCPGRQDCGNDCYWGSCYRRSSSDCCSSGHCPWNDCQSGYCNDNYSCGSDECGSDEYSGDGDCRHEACRTGCCGDEDCYTSMDDTGGISDDCSRDSDCCRTCCSSPYCGQYDGCFGNCDDCDDAVSWPDTNPFDGISAMSRPSSPRPGSGSSSLPARVHTSEIAVLDSSPRSTDLWWNDTDSAGCGGASRSDDFPIRIDNLQNGWSGDCSRLNPDDECGTPGGANYTFWAQASDTYGWWVHARNTTCVSYSDDCGSSYSGPEDWSQATSQVYVCRPDCRPILCGQNDGCGADQDYLGSGFNWFGDTDDDDCYWDENNNPSVPSIVYPGSGYTPGDPEIIQPTAGHPTSKRIDFQWTYSSGQTTYTDDNFRLEAWILNWGHRDDASQHGELSDPSDPRVTKVYEKTLSYGSVCSGSSCHYEPPGGEFKAHSHYLYAWRIAAHNVTCEGIDRSTNVGTSEGQVDTLDPDDCSNGDLCTGDSNRDWSTWTAGYFILDKYPQVLEITPTCSSRGGDCWSGSVDDNPENDQSVWPWEGSWTQPWDPPHGGSPYCSTHECEDMVSQNNPVVYEVEYEDQDGWEDLWRLHFTVTEPGESCQVGSDDNLGWARLQRATATSPCEPGSVCEGVSWEDNSTSEWTLLDGKIMRDSGASKKLKGYFKVKFETDGSYDSDGGEIKLCADADDFHTAATETVWQGDSWNWKVDTQKPLIDADATDPLPEGGHEITNLLRVDVDGPSLPCDPEFSACSDPGYDTWAFEVKIVLKDYDTGISGPSDLSRDTNPGKLARDWDPPDGVVTFDEREEHTEEDEFSSLAWYHNNYNGDVTWEWIRLSSDPALPFHYEVSPSAFTGERSVVLTLYVPAEDEETPIGGMHYQRTKEIRVQIRDIAGNVYDSGRNIVLFPGWFQEVNGDVYGNGRIEMKVPTEAQLASAGFPLGDNRWFLAADPNDSGGAVISRPASGILIDDADGSDRTSERGWKISSVSDGYPSPRLSVWDKALGFDWDELAEAATETLSSSYDISDDDDWGSLTPGTVYRLERVATGLEGSYRFDDPGVATIYIEGDIQLGSGDDVAGDNTFASLNGTASGIILAVDGDVTIKKDLLERLDAFIIATGKITFELGKALEPLEINGGLVAKEGFDVSRYIFDVYKPVFQADYNPLYVLSTEDAIEAHRECVGDLGDRQCVLRPGAGSDQCTTDTECATAPAPTLHQSCSHILDAGLSTGDGVYLIDPDGTGGNDPFQVYCDMTSDGGGWTLVMKIDGNSSNFVYHSSYWENSTTYNENYPDFDTTEAKLASFSTVPFSEIRLGMKVGGTTNWIKVPKTANSLLEVMQGGYQATSLGRATWKSLIDGSSLQYNCNLEGFNTYHSCFWDSGPGGVARARIGIIANQEGDCCSPDSRIALGGSGSYCGQDANNSCGNEATCSPDNGDKHTKGFGYIFVRSGGAPAL